MIIGFDTETYPIIKQGKATVNATPRTVCLTWSDGTRDRLLDRERAIDWFRAALDSDASLVAHNLPYDLLGMCQASWERDGADHREAVCAALDRGRFHDTNVRERLIQLTRGGCQSGGYSLALLAKWYLGRDVEGKSGLLSWRLRYAELDGVPVSEWPQAARDYAIEDARLALEVMQAQAARNERLMDGLHVRNEKFQVAADFAMSLMAARGMMIDQRWAHAVAAFFEREAARHEAPLKGWGIMRADGTVSRAAQQEIIRAAWESVGEEPKLTDSGSIACDQQTIQALEELGAEDERWVVWRAHARATKMLSTYMEPILHAGRRPVCPSYRVLVNTGRASAAAPNTTNLPARPNEDEGRLLAAWDGKTARERVRAGAIVAADIRGSFVPRPGHVLCDVDYVAAEMSTLAQVCYNLFGYITPLGDAINRGDDIHVRLAAVLLGGWRYERAVEVIKKGAEPTTAEEQDVRRIAGGEYNPKRVRSVAKIGNFGFPGLSGPQTFRVFARAQGIYVDLEFAKSVREAWFQTWPEMKDYFAAVQSWEDARGNYWIEQHGPHGMTRGWRKRRTDSAAAAANSPFQGLAADMAKLACYEVTRQQPGGGHLWNFVHDQLTVEAPEDRAQEALAGLERIMVEAGRVFCPNIAVRVEGEIRRERWGK